LRNLFSCSFSEWLYWFTFLPTVYKSSFFSTSSSAVC
jgi:hypothetical protein